MFIIATLLAAAAPVADAPTLPATSPVATQSTSSRYAVRYDRKTDRYCVRDRNASAPTGSRLVPQECKTSDAWAAEGLNIGRKS